MRSILVHLFLLTAAPLLIVASAGAEDIIVPASWEGVWETTTTEMNCQTLEVLSVETTLDTLCAGEVMNPEDPDGGFPSFACTGTVTDDSIYMECSGTMEVLPDCSFTISFISDGTRTGDTSTGVSINTFTYTGAGCLFFEDTCTRLESSSVRIGDDPGCVATPVASVRWGGLKSFYR